MTSTFKHLFTPLQVGQLSLKNRIFSSGHDTCLPTSDYVNEALIAYHQARAAGGAGLVVLQVSGVHETARYSSHLLMATDDGCIPGYRKLADACHAYDCKVVGQLFHPGREIMETKDGLQPVSYSASAVPNERFFQMPRAMSKALIAEVVAGYAGAARRMQLAGIDGVEIVASHGYLPAQFLSAAINQRTDEYGQDRLLFVQQIIEAIRLACGGDFTVGMRITGNEYDASGLQPEEALAAAVATQENLDYISLNGGTSNNFAGAVHIVPPMSVAQDYLQHLSAQWKQKLQVPLMMAGRMNQPQKAELALAAGAMDMCGMTRALICDPQMPNKAQAADMDNIRACIACNQACIGHFHRGLPISCIQYPQTGRELAYGQLKPAQTIKTVRVIGGGPAGMKAAVTAAQRSHEVHLYEQSQQLGGQVRLAQLLPERSEFGGLIGNLSAEMQLAEVNVHLNTRVDQAMLDAWQQDEVILATGAIPYEPTLEVMGNMPVYNAWQLLAGEKPQGKHLLVADWRGDWVSVGIAELLALAGHKVTLACVGIAPGQMLQSYVRDTTVARLHDLQVEILPNFRVFGYDDDIVYGQQTGNDATRLVEQVDGLVLAMGHTSVDQLATENSILIGDCLTPRTAEEAILEGLQAGVAV
jgi:2,4-dienoyl-CoA reductase-like NADH-dependent reductase (Old Yellow Enzyme family)/thioredoxin reductase